MGNVHVWLIETGQLTFRHAQLLYVYIHCYVCFRCRCCCRGCCCCCCCCFCSHIYPVDFLLPLLFSSVSTVSQALRAPTVVGSSLPSPLPCALCWIFHRGKGINTFSTSSTRPCALVCRASWVGSDLARMYVYAYATGLTPQGHAREFRSVLSRKLCVNRRFLQSVVYYACLLVFFSYRVFYRPRVQSLPRNNAGDVADHFLLVVV